VRPGSAGIVAGVVAGVVAGAGGGGAGGWRERGNGGTHTFSWDIFNYEAAGMVDECAVTRRQEDEVECPKGGPRPGKGKESVV
jgi:hypothetical protein